MAENVGEGTKKEQTQAHRTALDEPDAPLSCSERPRACSAVRQRTVVPRSGRRGRRFKSCHPDQCRRSLTCANAALRWPAFHSGPPADAPKEQKRNTREPQGKQTPRHSSDPQGTLIPRQQRRGRRGLKKPGGPVTTSSDGAHSSDEGGVPEQISAEALSVSCAVLVRWLGAAGRSWRRSHGR